MAIEREQVGHGAAWRAFRIIDRVSRGGEGLAPKRLAETLGVSPSTCYQLLNVLLDEGYLDKLPDQAGYRLGPAIETLHRRARRQSADGAVGAIVQALAERAGAPAYLGRLTEDEDVLVAEAAAPSGGPAIGVPRGLCGPAHALALGKALIAAGGVTSIDSYLERQALDAVTPQTITDPVQLEAHFKEVLARGYATEFEEFAKGQYCVAVSLLSDSGTVHGAIGLAVAGDPAHRDVPRAAELARGAAQEAMLTLHYEPERRHPGRLVG
ncbi:MAG TPA: IclR family transcriptional regulator C-terminal domain-containing protein [Solirubrobacteraceae bacterium]